MESALGMANGISEGPVGPPGASGSMEASQRQHLPEPGLMFHGSDILNEIALDTTDTQRLPVELQAYAALLEQLKTRYSSEQLADVGRAFVLARDAHSGQTRSSGEPYITHPIAVAAIVFSMNLDHKSVMAALMHDVLEDTPVTRESLVDEFGEEVTHIVDGVSKLSHLKFRSRAEAQAESFRKMLLAMVSDIRVIMIKLADRLHNMRTIGALRPDKRRRIGKETLEVYAPIASRLGMFAIKNNLEDLGFEACYPMRSRILERTVAQYRQNDRIIDQVIERINAGLSEKGIEAQVAGREKHLYSLYLKMQKKQVPFERIFDMLAMRVIVDTVEECYQVLGIIHQLYPPIFSRFKDYIAVPKQNGYQSLHTVVNHGDEATPIEVQVRTKDMHEMAESGIAAHWAFKTADASSPASLTPGWLSGLADLHKGATDTVDTVEFVENVKIDLFPGQIYVFTPKGKIIQLPKNATSVDFAYAVHSEVGNKCVSAKVDRRLVSLSEPLKSGQTIEINTGTSIAISPMWLNSVVTAKARTAIRQHLRALDHSEAVRFGKRLLLRALGRHEYTLETLSNKAVDAMLSERHFSGIDELYLDVGLGNQLPSQVAERLIALDRGEDLEPAELPVLDAAPVMIDSASSPTLYMAQCCRPIPGDNVQGFITPGKGVAVHRAGCRNIRRFRRRPKEWVAVEWASDIKGHFQIGLLCHLVHQPGALARVTATMSSMNANIENMDFNNRNDDDISIRFVLSVRDRKQLAKIVRKLRNLTVVRSVKRDA
ncbi:MAG: bifunctional (p)ppGpp synthetase/guanosine-3',5'-bis(diphosphate) 3'-pyrophosphohydrolase [Granulosicoccus sp.]|nr:bifunctional (p)ppGpp synthetase/guanosine-3',5'-bis(diphosphate) 3'-pyrophosphohydrolase [Granulosicoccus sp.]